jgi:hypothetical protein
MLRNQAANREFVGARFIASVLIADAEGRDESRPYVGSFA